MKRRHLVVWFSGLTVLAAGTTLLRAEPQDAPRAGQARADRPKLRAQVIKLRTEVEMLGLDYEIAREGLLEEIKMSRSLKMASGLISSVGSIQAAIHGAGDEPPGAAAQPVSKQDKNKADEEAKAAEQDEKKQAAEEAAFVAKEKKELSRLYALLSAKRLDLEDAERKYAEASR